MNLVCPHVDKLVNRKSGKQYGYEHAQNQHYAGYVHQFHIVITSQDLLMTQDLVKSLINVFKSVMVENTDKNVVINVIKKFMVMMKVSLHL